MIKKAMILAAGFGKRLHPWTMKQPKPWLKIGKETLLSNTFNFLAHLGVKDVVINLHYLAEQIISYINNSNFNLNIRIIRYRSNESQKSAQSSGIIGM